MKNNKNIFLFWAIVLILNCIEKKLSTIGASICAHIFFIQSQKRSNAYTQQNYQSISPSTSRNLIICLAYLLEFIEPHIVGHFQMAQLGEHHVYPGIHSFHLLIPSKRIRQIPQPELDAGQKSVDLKQEDDCVCSLHRCAECF